MGNKFSIYDCDNIVDIITALGKPRIKKRLNPIRDVYMWDHYIVIVRHEDGHVVSIKDRDKQIVEKEEDIVIAEVC